MTTVATTSTLRGVVGEVAGPRSVASVAGVAPIESTQGSELAMPAEFFNAHARVRAYVERGWTLPAAVYHLEQTLTLGAGESLLMEDGAELRAAHEDEMVCITGSGASLLGGAVNGAREVTGWRDEGDGTWSCVWPYDWRCLALARNDRALPVSRWPNSVEGVGCIRFPGDHRYALVGTVGEFDSVFLGGASWTIAAWYLCTPGSSVSYCTAFKYGVGTGYLQNINLDYYDRKPVIAVRDTGWKQLASDDVFDHYNYVLVVASYDAATGKLKQWVNDRAVKELSVGTITLPAGANTEVGGWRSAQTTTNYGFSGRISFLGLWTRAFTDADRDELWNNRERKFWPEFSAGFKVSAKAIWEFADPADLGKDTLGAHHLTPKLVAIPDRNGLDCPRTGLRKLDTPGNVSWGSNWAVDRVLPASESYLQMVSMSLAWNPSSRLDVAFNATTNTVDIAPSAAGVGNYPSSVVFKNGKSFLTPGHWCHRPDEGRLYYMPAGGETLADSVFEAPYSGVLITREGTIPAMTTQDYYANDDGLSTVIENVVIDGVEFKHARDTSPGTFLFRDENRRGSTGGRSLVFPVDFKAKTKNFTVRNCLFYHLGGDVAVVLGDQYVEDFTFRNNLVDTCWGDGVAVGMRPAEATAGRNYRVKIQKNTIRNIGQVIHGDCANVRLGNVWDVEVTDNELSGSPYCGINTANNWTFDPPTPNQWQYWKGGTNGLISRNWFHDLMLENQDGAGIYSATTSGASSGAATPVASVSDNLFEDIDNWSMAASSISGAVYLDLGSQRNWHVMDNVIGPMAALPAQQNNAAEPADIDVVRGMFYCRNYVPRDGWLLASYYPIDENMESVEPKVATGLTFIGPNDASYSLISGTPRVDDGMTGNVAYENYGFGEMDAVIAAWKAAHTTGTTVSLT